MDKWPEVYPRDLSKPLLQRDAAEYPWVFECAVHRCVWHTVHPTKEEANRVRAEHHENTCPLWTPAREGARSLTSIIAKCWERMDKTVDELMKLEINTDEHTRLRGKVAGIAECIYEYSVPFFPGPNKVMVHAKARWEAKQDGFDMPDTPGLRGYNPYAYTREKLTPAPKKVAPKPQPRPAIKIDISDSKRGAIEFGIKQNLPLDDVAEAFNTTREIVDQVKAAMGI